jgi:hypothetical protein
VFDGFYEFPIGLALACVLLLVRLAARSRADGSARNAPSWRFGARRAITGALVGARRRPTSRPRHVLYQERSFFGVLRVEEIRSRRRTASSMHGTTMHGSRSRADDKADRVLRPAHGIEIALALRDPTPPRSA